jgi:hypothetical protein
MFFFCPRISISIFLLHCQASAPTHACIYLPNIQNLTYAIFSDLPTDYTAVKYSSFQLPFYTPNTEWPKKMYKHCTLILMSKERIHFGGPLCILVFFFVIKPSRCNKSTNLFCHENLHVSESSSAHHQEYIHSTLICHTGL